jgi:hypothetical protein
MTETASSRFGLDQAFKDLEVQVPRTPFRAPKANAICERLVGTVRRECLDFLIPLNERHLKAILKACAPHYNSARPHKGLGKGLELARTAWTPELTRDWDVSSDGSLVAIPNHDPDSARIRLVPLDAANGEKKEREIVLPDLTDLTGVHWIVGGEGWLAAVVTPLGDRLLFADIKGHWPPSAAFRAGRCPPRTDAGLRSEILSSPPIPGSLNCADRWKRNHKLALKIRFGTLGAMRAHRRRVQPKSAARALNQVGPTMFVGAANNRGRYVVGALPPFHTLTAKKS